ncbi:UPF0102 protein [Devosia pacifica]|uniref:UPF0102 protein GCM10007989_18140 n=1 Tax=Devosia pacifica TaxID=1335967 RepID=A0A918VT62_9HYPH|nr:YraN family protein [Devosia pacifica]GHA23032.1 UPF0102 protein [Devosia pacifica]
MRPSFSNKKPDAELAKRRRAFRAGHRGEFWAALFLQLKLYRVLARRVKTPVGEIDIVARRFGVTVFVEVKTRARSQSLAEAWDAVNTRRICAAAQHYLARHPTLYAGDQRFDVIFVAPFAIPRHVVNAFDAD